MKSDEQWDGDVDGLSRGRRGALESERQEWQQRSDDLHGEEDCRDADSQVCLVVCSIGTCWNCSDVGGIQRCRAPFYTPDSDVEALHSGMTSLGISREACRLYNPAAKGLMISLLELNIDIAVVLLQAMGAADILLFSEKKDQESCACFRFPFLSRLTTC